MVLAAAAAAILAILAIAEAPALTLARPLGVAAAGRGAERGAGQGAERRAGPATPNPTLNPTESLTLPLWIPSLKRWLEYARRRWLTRALSLKSYRWQVSK